MINYIFLFFPICFNIVVMLIYCFIFLIPLSSPQHISTCSIYFHIVTHVFITTAKSSSTSFQVLFLFLEYVPVRRHRNVWKKFKKKGRKEKGKQKKCEGKERRIGLDKKTQSARGTTGTLRFLSKPFQTNNFCFVVYSLAK